MVKGKVLVMLAVLMVLTSCRGTGQTKADGEGRAYDVEGLAVFDLHGDWHQMGQQYGALAWKKMVDVLAYLDLKMGNDSARMASAADIADKLYAHYPAHLKDFLSGVSETSGLTLERVKLCNAVEYVEGVFLCSAMAVWDEYGAGKLVVGRNYDAVSYSEIDRDIVVTVYHPDGGMAAATVGYAGELYCVNGLNEEGLFFEFNNGMPSAGAEIHWDLCPSTTSLFELLFQAENLDDVDAFFMNTRSALSSTIGVADKAEARAYEWCYDGVRRGDEMTADGLMISTNHYVHDGWPFSTPSDEASWNSITRRRNLEAKAVEHKGHIDVGRMKEIMSTSLENDGPMHSLTRYQIVAVPEDKTLHIKVPGNEKWVEINLSDFL